MSNAKPTEIQSIWGHDAPVFDTLPEDLKQLPIWNAISTHAIVHDFLGDLSSNDDDQVWSELCHNALKRLELAKASRDAKGKTQSSGILQVTPYSCNSSHSCSITSIIPITSITPITSSRLSHSAFLSACCSWTGAFEFNPRKHSKTVTKPHQSRVSAHELSCAHFEHVHRALRRPCAPCSTLRES